MNVTCSKHPSGEQTCGWCFAAAAMTQYEARVAELDAAMLRNDERHAEAMRSVRLRAEKAEARVRELEAELEVTRKAYMHVDGKVAAVKIARAEARVAELKEALRGLLSWAHGYCADCDYVADHEPSCKMAPVVAAAERALSADSVSKVTNHMPPMMRQAVVDAIVYGEGRAEVPRQSEAPAVEEAAWSAALAACPSEASAMDRAFGIAPDFPGERSETAKPLVYPKLRAVVAAAKAYRDAHTFAFSPEGDALCEALDALETGGTE